MHRKQTLKFEPAKILNQCLSSSYLNLRHQQFLLMQQNTVISVHKTRHNQLKYSKSQIHLSKRRSDTKSKHVKSRLKLFTNKEDTRKNYNIFHQTCNRQLKQNRPTYNSNFGYTTAPSLTRNIKLAVSNSNWVSKSNLMQNAIKLRNLKRSNNYKSEQPSSKDKIQHAHQIKNSEPPQKVDAQTQINETDKQNYFGTEIINKSSKVPNKDLLQDKQTTQQHELPQKICKNDKCLTTEKFNQKYSEQPQHCLDKRQDLVNQNENSSRQVEKTINIQSHSKQDQDTNPDSKKLQPEQLNLVSQNAPKELTSQNAQAIPHKQIKLTAMPEINQDEIEEITFSKRINLESKEQKKNQLSTQHPIQKVQSKIFKSINPSQITNRNLRQQTIINKPPPPILPILTNAQLDSYIKHFENMLKFYKQNMTKVSNLPHTANLMYVINIQYFKTLIEHRNLQSNEIYRPLINLLERKQQKIPQNMKKMFKIFNLEIDWLWIKSKKLHELQEDLLSNSSAYLRGLKLPECQEEIKQFLTISEQSGLILSQILGHLTDYVQCNKQTLIQQNLFLIVLEFNFQLATAIIISKQRYNYYKQILSRNYTNLHECFKLSNSNQLLIQYRSELQGINVLEIDPQEELQHLLEWIRESNDQ